MNFENQSTKPRIDAGSFRDPSGFIFFYQGRLYRQINKYYRNHYRALFSSGLYERLMRDKLLIPHETVEINSPAPDLCYKIISPAKIPFLSYPYEWCFGQLKDAALTTLRIQKIALNHGLSLKDASAFNIQFHKGRPLLIDTLSFEILKAGTPWTAYRQFCQHFLAPLALMSKTDLRLNRLIREFMDGLPLDLASRLLPLHTYFSFSLLAHIHLHAQIQKRFAAKTITNNRSGLSARSLESLIENLQNSVSKLKLKNFKSEWSDYYHDTNYSTAAQKEKENIIKDYLAIIKPRTVWDLGANTGRYSRLASTLGAMTIAFDLDLRAVEKNYSRMVAHRENSLLPLFLDLTNPSPALGWAHQERMSLAERSPADLVMALALIHHLAIANNLPFSLIANFLKKITPALIIEFVPKNDSNAQRLLRSRTDIFSNYEQSYFEHEFSKFFDIKNAIPLKNSQRTIYLMIAKG